MPDAGFIPPQSDLAAEALKTVGSEPGWNRGTECQMWRRSWETVEISTYLFAGPLFVKKKC